MGALPAEAFDWGDALQRTPGRNIGLPLVRGRQLSVLDIEKSASRRVDQRNLREEGTSAQTIRSADHQASTVDSPVAVADPTFEIVGVVENMANQVPASSPTPRFFSFTVVSLPGLHW